MIKTVSFVSGGPYGPGGVLSDFEGGGGGGVLKGYNRTDPCKDTHISRNKLLQTSLSVSERTLEVRRRSGAMLEFVRQPSKRPVS